MKPLIELKNISVVYNQGKSNETVAVHDISLEIYEGEYIVFLGPSGSGKSTLLYTIAGLESPTSGEIRVASEDLKTIGAKEKIKFYRTTIGMIFQAFYLVPHLTAKDNVILPQMFSGAEKNDREVKAQKLIDRFGISVFSDRKPSMMSGGQQQRTAIARALVNDPLIILADEPVGNLDSKNSSIVLELLDDIHKKEKKTIIQVTHNAADVKYADRVFYIRDGVIEKIVVNTKDPRVNSAAVSLPEGQATTLKNAGTELVAALIMRRIFRHYDIETEEKISYAIGRFVKKEITAEELRHTLDAKDGAGLYSQRAEHISREAEKMLKEMDELLGKEEDKKDAVSVILYHLMSTYSGMLSREQLKRLSSALHRRLSGEFNKSLFQIEIDKPLKQGGVGLNSRTALHFAEEVEFIVTHK